MYNERDSQTTWHKITDCEQIVTYLTNINKL